MTESTQFNNDLLTHCSVLTGAGRSAIAVIELLGPRAEDCLRRCVRLATPGPLLPGQIRYGHWVGATGLDAPACSDDPAVAAESVVVLPHAHDRFEVHCHGGPAAVERLMDDLQTLGVVPSPPHPAHGVPYGDQADLIQDRLVVEALEVLSRCTTIGATAVVLDQVRGALTDWRNRCCEALQQESQASCRIAAEAMQMVSAGRVGVRLTRPFDVVLAGPPNVGKSSLINAMVGYDRSITMDLPGTTRDVLDAETVFDGWPLRLRDTAGMHQHAETLEREGIDRAIDAVLNADLLVLVGQPRNPPDSAPTQTFRQASLGPELAAKLSDEVPVLQVLNKADLAPQADRQGDSEENLRTVATNGQGVPELMGAIVASLTAALPPLGSPVPLCQRQLDWLNAIASSADDPNAMGRLLQA